MSVQAALLRNLAPVIVPELVRAVEERGAESVALSVSQSLPPLSLEDRERAAAFCDALAGWLRLTVPGGS